MVGRARWLIGVTVLAVIAAAGLAGAQALRAGVAAPELAGAPWINSGSLTTAGLKGKVVAVEFWTYG